MRLDNDSQHSATKSRRLKKITDRITDSVYMIEQDESFDDLQTILEVICDSVEAEVASLWIYNRYTTNKITILSSFGGSSDIASIAIDPGQGIAGKVIANNEAIIIDNCQKDVRWEKKVDDKTKFETRSMVCVPLVFESIVFGCLQIINADYGVFDDVDSEFIDIISTALTEMMARKKYIIGYLAGNYERRYLITYNQEHIRFISTLYAEICDFNEEIIPKIGIRKAVSLVNKFYSYVSGLAIENGGYIDEYQGAKLLVTWNTTEEYDNAGVLAAKTAINIREKLKEFNNSLKDKYGLKIQIKTAINYGPAYVGIFGRVENYDYTAIGSTIDQVQELTKKYGKPNDIVCTSSLINDMNLPTTKTYLDTVDMGEGKSQEIYTLSDVVFED